MAGNETIQSTSQEERNKAARKPPVVIFAAIWNFASVAFWMIGACISLAAVIFGNVLGLYDLAAKQLSQVYQAPNYTYGLTVLFAAIFVLCAVFSLFGILLGVCLLKGKKFAWYLQITLSVLSLFNPVAFPVSTGVNVAILVLFFRQNVRDYFGV